MKKILFVLFTLATSYAMAQDGAPQGPPPRMDSAQMHGLMVKRYQASGLGLTDAQIDSVVSINQQLMGQGRPQGNSDRKKEREAQEKAKLERLTAALGDEQLAKKVMDYDKKNRRPGPGGPGGMMPPPDGEQN